MDMGLCMCILKVMSYCERECYFSSALAQSSYCDMTTLKWVGEVNPSSSSELQGKVALWTSRLFFLCKGMFLKRQAQTLSVNTAYSPLDGFFLFCLPPCLMMLRRKVLAMIGFVPLNWQHVCLAPPLISSSSLKLVLDFVLCIYWSSVKQLKKKKSLWRDPEFVRN